MPLQRIAFAASASTLDDGATALIEAAVQSFADDSYARRIMLIGIERGPVESALVAARLRSVQTRVETLGIPPTMIEARVEPPTEHDAADTVVVSMHCPAF